MLYCRQFTNKIDGIQKKFCTIGTIIGIERFLVCIDDDCVRHEISMLFQETEFQQDLYTQNKHRKKSIEMPPISVEYLQRNAKPATGQFSKDLILKGFIYGRRTNDDQVSHIVFAALPFLCP